MKLKPAGWIYKILVDKHTTGPPLEGQINMYGVWGTPSDHVYYSPKPPSEIFAYWKSQVYMYEEET